MGLNKEVWVADIIATLERDAEFLSRMKDMSEFVYNNRIHIPNSGDATTIFKNVTNFPLSVAQRTDTETVIQLDQYSTQAFLVTDIETAQLTYNKRDSIMGQHSRKLIETIGDTILQNLAPTAPAHQVVVAGPKVTYADILAVAKIMDQDNVLKSERHLELPTDMYYDLLSDESISKQYASGFSQSVVGTGQVLTVAGIQIHTRPQVALLNGHAAGVAYQKDSVGKAVGTVDFFTDFGDNGAGNPLYLGGIMSAVMWMGATRLRTDNKGVVALVRAA